MSHRRPRRRTAATAALVILSLVATACSRGSDESQADTTPTTSVAVDGTTASTAPASGLDAAAFGDLENVCQDGDASGATDIGVTDDSIQVGTLTDKGFSSRPGLIQEMYDAAVAFANWCNEHGGINGRELVIADRDAAIVDYNARVIESCAEDLALVGGGATLDDADNGGRIACGLPSIPAFTVSLAARSAGVEELQVQPVPNSPDVVNAGVFQQIAAQRPDLADGFGVLTAQFGSTLVLRDQTIVAAEDSGLTVVYSEEYNSLGEANWRPFVEGMRSDGVKVLEMIGEPTYLAQLMEAMNTVGYFPELIVLQPNFYDAAFAELAGDIAENVRIRLQFTPFELAEQNEATSDYLEMMERYNAGGKVAMLGMQATSALLLFAQAASACGSELTRACLIEQAASVTEWTGGGLHAPQSPATTSPSVCFLVLTMSTDGFAVDEDLTGATDGPFNCEADNILPVT